MKKILMAIAFSLFCVVPYGHAYVIDGDVSDWGVDLSPFAAKNIHYLDTNTPTASSVSFVTEDNASVATSSSTYVGPGWSTKNIYDAEAMYLDNDNNNVYLAIVTGLKQFGAQYAPGDIFFDTGKYQNPLSSFYNPKKFAYGIDIATSKLYSVNSWDNATLFSQANPWAINSGTYLADVPFVYSGDQNSHYVLEASVPVSLLGLKNGDDLWAHWTMQCGNDTLNLKKNVVVTPEPSSAVLLALGLMAAVFVFRKKLMQGCFFA